MATRLNALGQDAYNLKRASDPDQSLANGRESVLGAGRPATNLW